jgi:hypothetical protein
MRAPRAAAELASTICRFSSMNFATRRPVAPSCWFALRSTEPSKFPASTAASTAKAALPIIIAE